jgi:hypothetical protein
MTPPYSRISMTRSLIAHVSARVAAARSTDPESGALSLEWVAIAIVLVAAALALATFLSGKLGSLESLIPS